jgi:hypothetical protein
MGGAVNGRLSKTSCFTGGALKPKYLQTALAPLEDHQRDDSGHPVEDIGQHSANCAK